jgi:hypothetical protein
MATPKRSTIEAWADRLGYELNNADREVRRQAASRNEPIPRFQLTPHRAKYANEVIACVTLSDVVDELIKIEIDTDRSERRTRTTPSPEVRAERAAKRSRRGLRRALENSIAQPAETQSATEPQGPEVVQERPRPRVRRM